MTIFNVNIERTVAFDFMDDIDIPDSVVAKGRQAVREYIIDVVDDYDMERETIREHVIFEEA